MQESFRKEIVMYKAYMVPGSTILKCFMLAHRQGGVTQALIQRTFAYCSPKIEQQTTKLVHKMNKERRKQNKLSLSDKEEQQVRQLLSILAIEQIQKVAKETEASSLFVNTAALYRNFEERIAFLEKIEQAS